MISITASALDGIAAASLQLSQPHDCLARPAVIGSLPFRRQRVLVDSRSKRSPALIDNIVQTVLLPNGLARYGHAETNLDVAHPIPMIDLHEHVIRARVYPGIII